MSRLRPTPEYAYLIASSLADSFARAGFVTVAPDLFQGSPAPSDLNDPTFNTTAFLAAHGPDVTDPIVESTSESTPLQEGADFLSVLFMSPGQIGVAGRPA